MCRDRHLVVLVTLSLALSVVSSIAGAACTGPPVGLRAWWGGDGNAGDVFGTWGGMLVGDATFVTGQVGEAFSFDGSGDRVDVLDPVAGVLGADPFTVAFWVRTDADHVADYLVGKSYPNGGDGWDIRLGDRRLYLEGLNGWDPQWNLRTDQVITIGRWHHVAVTSDGMTTTLYLDGATDPAWTIPRQPVSGTSNPLRFGFTTGYGGTQLDGALDEVQLYDRALSQEEVQGLAAAVPDGACRPCAALPRDAFGWWRAENSVADEIGFADGTLGGDATYADGRVGRAFSFNGDGWVELPDSPAWDFGSGSFSVSAWFRSAPATSYHNLLRHHDGSGNPGYWGLRLNSSGQLQWLIEDSAGGGEIALTSTGSYDDGEWHAATAVRDAVAGELRLYVDGAEVATPIADGDADVTGAASFRMSIGSGLWDDGRRYEPFVGEIDEVMMVGRAVTATQARVLANAGASGVCAGCTGPMGGRVSWWRGEGSAQDSVAANHGLLVNDASFAAGRAGQAFSLDAAGPQDLVEIAHDASLVFQSATPVSVDFWLLRDSDLSPQHLLSKRLDCDATSFGYQLRWDSGTGELCFGSDVGSVCTTASALPRDAWTHLAASFDGTTGSLWVNGQPAATSAMQLGQDVGMPPLRLGGVACDADGTGLHGRLDEVQIHGRALYRDEVYALHAAGSHGACVDAVPEAYTFTDQTGAPLSTTVASDEIIVSGVDSAASAPISIAACTSGSCEYSVNGGAWASAAGAVVAGDGVQVRQTSSASYAATTDLTLDIGGVTDTFSVTTLPQHTLTVSVTGEGTVTSTPAGIDCPTTSCAALFEEGQVVTLTPVPASHWRFVGFDGDADCTDGEVALTGDVACTATFEPEPLFEDGFESGDTTAWSNGFSDAQVLLNEVDANQWGHDVHEFIELYNSGTSAADLSEYHLLLCYRPEGRYAEIGLSGMLGAGQHLVVCDDTAGFASCGPTRFSVDLRDSDGSGVALVRREITSGTETLVDSVGYYHTSSSYDHSCATTTGALTVDFLSTTNGGIAFMDGGNDSKSLQRTGGLDVNDGSMWSPADRTPGSGVASP